MPTKPRFAVFHLDSEPGLRGGERQLLYLACWLRSAGHENAVVCRRGAALESEAARLGFRTLNLPFLSEWDPLSAGLLRRWTSSSPLQPILHAHTGHAAALAFLASRAGGPPWVVHRRVDFRLSGALSRRLKYGSAGKIIAVSRSVAGILEEDGVPSSRIETICDCVPATKEEAAMAGLERPFAPLPKRERRELRARLAAQWDIPPDSPWIGNVAALVGHKDQANFLRCAAMARPKAPAARWLLIGEGPLRAELEALARSLGLADAVRFTGRQKDPVLWLNALDVFALSSWGEGLGSVLLEAMACRLPVAATTAGGIPEVIEDQVTGLLAPPRDPKGLAEAVLRLLTDVRLRERVTEAASRRLADFSLAACGTKVGNIYSSLLAGREARC